MQFDMPIVHHQVVGSNLAQRGFLIVDYFPSRPAVLHVIGRAFGDGDIGLGIFKANAGFNVQHLALLD